MVIKSNTLIVSNNSSDLSFHIYPPINLNSNEQHENWFGRTDDVQFDSKY